MKKSLVLLGSTGSIGTQTLEVASILGINVMALSANKNIRLLYSQVLKYKPEYVVITDQTAYQELKKIDLPDTIVLYGGSGLNIITSLKTDIVVNALTGFAGLKSTIDAIEAGNDLALANKESLVTFGAQIMKRAVEKNVAVIPVDSEHSAIFQCMKNERSENIRNIILTASGGPFRTKTESELEFVTVEQTLKHPNWDMGKKITVDSATMMNKGLEVIEARYLFDVNKENIKVVIHRESIIHSMVEFTDGAYLAQLSNPDMKIPIMYAITYPDRIDSKVQPIEFDKLAQLNFEKVEFNKYKCLKLAYDALEYKNSMNVVLNAANEECVEAFLNRKIRFIEISSIIEKIMNMHDDRDLTEYEDVMSLNNETREKTAEIIGGK